MGCRFEFVTVSLPLILNEASQSDFPSLWFRVKQPVMTTQQAGKDAFTKVEDIEGKLSFCR